MNEAFWYANVSWHGKQCGASCFTLYYICCTSCTKPYSSPNGKITQQHILIVHCLHRNHWFHTTLHTFTFMWDGMLGTTDETSWLYTFYPKWVRELEFHTWFNIKFYLYHIWLCFPYIFHQPIIAQIYLTIITFTLNIKYNLNIETHYSLSHVLHRNVIFCLIGHIWPPKMIIIYLSNTLLMHAHTKIYS